MFLFVKQEAVHYALLPLFLFPGKFCESVYVCVRIYVYTYVYKVYDTFLDVLPSIHAAGRGEVPRRTQLPLLPLRLHRGEGPFAYFLTCRSSLLRNPLGGLGGCAVREKVRFCAIIFLRRNNFVVVFFKSLFFFGGGSDDPRIR